MILKAYFKNYKIVTKINYNTQCRDRVLLNYQIVWIFQTTLIMYIINSLEIVGKINKGGIKVLIFKNYLS